MNNKKLTYQQVEDLLSKKSDKELIDLIDDQSKMIGDTAAELLYHRNKKEIIRTALLEEKSKRKIGKIRLLNILLRYGKTYPEAIDAYLKFVSDINPEVVNTALFGIVFWQNRKYLNILKCLDDIKSKDRINLAIKAIENGDPKIYSPYLKDKNGVW
jgi:hypothetical protein